MLVPIGLMQVGFILILISIKEYLHFKKLLRTGTTTEGIIYSTDAGDSSQMNSQYPTVRFTTHNKEWITEKYRMGLIPGILKPGRQVKVFYDPGNPSDFVIDAPFVTIIFLFAFIQVLLQQYHLPCMER